MLEYDYQLIAIVNGWIKLKYWYHPFATELGWHFEHKRFITAEEAVKYQIETVYPIDAGNKVGQ